MAFPRCAFLTKQHGVFAGQDDPLLADALERRGWSIEAVDWKDEAVSWEAFDLVFLRSPWDYYLSPELFLARLREISSRCGRLIHSESLVEANINKRYLTQLGRYQEWVIPSEIVPANDVVKMDWKSRFRLLKPDRLIVKPLISAGSFRTLALDLNQLGRSEALIAETFPSEGVIVQPFLPTICDDGEHSSFFWGASIIMRYSNDLSQVTFACRCSTVGSINGGSPILGWLQPRTLCLSIFSRERFTLGWIGCGTRMQRAQSPICLWKLK